MNGRQAARAAAEKIAEMEWVLSLNKRDIVLYNRCIEHMIQHGSPCDYCENHDECQQAGKDLTIGCDEWLLKLWEEGEQDDGGNHDEERAGGRPEEGNGISGSLQQEQPLPGATAGIQ